MNLDTLSILLNRALINRSFVVGSKSFHSRFQGAAMYSHSTLQTALAVVFFATASFADTANDIPHQKSLTLRVGQSAVIYGYRGDCGALPGPGDVTVPALKTGKLSIGKPGQRNSRKCGGVTPAVEIIFTATAPGSDSFKLQGDPIRIKVQP
ncbi:MAG: hypothetical protein WAK98_08550 [Gemmobacter sp.]